MNKMKETDTSQAPSSYHIVFTTQEVKQSLYSICR